MRPVLVLALAALPLFGQPPQLPLTEIPLKVPDSVKLGTVSSIAASVDGTTYILHRGTESEPIIGLRDGAVVRSFGRGLFDQPHSIRIDPAGNIWTADAGNSHILKFSPSGELLQTIEVGEVATGDRCAFPNLCGTTDLAFGPNGRLFIADGYGNARVLEYSAEGDRVNEWGTSGTGPKQFQIPHGIATNGTILFVADRTNSRIQQLYLNGEFVREWTHLGRPYALKFAGGALWVAGMNPGPVIQKVDPITGEILGQIAAPGPHAIDVTESGEVFATGCCGGSNPTGFSRFAPSVP